MEFLQTLYPWANWWNGCILLADIFVAIFGHLKYKKTKSRQLRGALPGVYTSLGLLGTFGAICTSLAGIADSHAIDEASKIGKAVEEISALTGDLDLKRIISDLIPAFSTSIYGLVFAIISTIRAKLAYADEDFAIEQNLKFKNPDELLDNMGENLSELKGLMATDIEANSKNNEELKETIQAQSKIFSEFVNTFVQQMESTFSAMKDTIGERVNAFGEEQFKQSKFVLEGLTQRLNEETQQLVSNHTVSVQSMTSSIEDAVSSLKTNTVAKIEELASSQQEALQKLSEDSLKSQIDQLEALKQYTLEQSGIQKESIAKQNEFNTELLNQMSSTVSGSMNQIIDSIQQQCGLLQNAIVQDIELLKKSFEFMDSKSSDIISNYEQATEAYRDAVQNSHDLNDSFEKSISAIDNTLKSTEKTNKGINQVIDVISSKETNIEAIVMRIEEMSKAIATLQRLEASISKISGK